MSYQAILFDLDNTLIDRDAAVERYLETWVGALDESERCEIREQDCHGYSPRLAFASWFATRFESRLRAPISGPELWAHMRRHLGEFVETEPGTDALLEHLSQRFELGLITNGSELNQRAKLVSSGLSRHFDTVLISQNVGTSKPGAPIFRRALRTLDVEASDTLFVGDHPRADIRGAAIVGMDTAWMRLGREWDRALASPTYELDHLGELRERLLS